MSPLFGLGLYLAPSVRVRCLASSAFLSHCFFPFPWHLPCAAPLSLMSSLHIHCLSLLISWRVLVQRTAQKIFVLICFLCSPHSQPHSFLQNPALPGSIPEAGSSCQAILVTLLVSLLFPSIFPAPLGSQIALTTAVSSSMARLASFWLVRATLSCFSGHIDKSFPCRTGTEVIAADRCWNNSLCLSVLLTGKSS